MGVFTKPDAVIDLNLPFLDEAGEKVTLRDRVPSDKPFILVPIFFECPRLCSLTLSGVVQLVNQLSLTLGEDYSVLAYTFNPAEGPREAAEKRAATLKRLKSSPRDPRAWRFLSGNADSIATLNGQLDFRVRMADKEFEHSSAIFIVDPSGLVRRYFAGIEFEPKKVQVALVNEDDKFHPEEPS